MTSYSDYYSDIYSDIYSDVEEDDFKSINSTFETGPDNREHNREHNQEPHQEPHQDTVHVKERRPHKLKLVTKLKRFALLIKKSLKNPYQKKMNKKQKIEKLP